MFELMDSHGEEAVIKVIGVGGGGGNAVEHMVSQSIEGVFADRFFCSAKICFGTRRLCSPRQGGLQ